MKKYLTPAALCLVGIVFAIVGYQMLLRGINGAQLCVLSVLTECAAGLFSLRVTA